MDLSIISYSYLPSIQILSPFELPYSRENEQKDATFSFKITYRKQAPSPLPPPKAGVVIINSTKEVICSNLRLGQILCSFYLPLFHRTGLLLAVTLQLCPSLAYSQVSAQVQNMKYLMKQHFSDSSISNNSTNCHPLTSQ